MNNNVILKGKKDRLAIHLDRDVDFETLKESLRSKLKSAGKFFQEGDIAIEFVDRDLSEEEENSLLKIISEEGLDISCLISKETSRIETDLFRKSLIDEGLTKFFRGSLRSGGSLESEGNIVILGDVNPGARVRASGNIVVLGYLNGTAHAGGLEEDGAFIAALKMNPIQLRIGQRIARSPNGDMLTTNRIKKGGSLEVAYIKDGNMLIEGFSKKTLENMMKF